MADEYGICYLDICPNYDGENIELCFIPTLVESETDARPDLLWFKLSPDEARLLAKLLIVAAETDSDNSFRMNTVRAKRPT